MSNSSNSNMSNQLEDSVMSNQLDDSDVLKLTGQIMMVAIIVLFAVVVVVFFLHLYAKWFWYRRQQDGATRRRQQLSSVTVLRHGLDPSVLKSIPVVEFSSENFKEGIECTVCLSEVSDGEKARLLPKCNHGFHVECIDMWFQSHSTCPICRNPVSSSSLEEVIIETPAPEEESQNIPTNVLFWGNESQVSSMGENQIQGSSSIAPQLPSSSSTSNRRDGELVIDIPRRTNEEEDPKSPMPMPTPTRMRSLKRLLSRVNPCSPSSNVDVEQVGRGQN